MFVHIFIYRFKCLFRDKILIFWSLIFPIILATLFNLALSNISNAEKYEKVKIAVVDDQKFQENTEFRNIISQLSTTDSDENIFDISLVNEKEAEDLLKENKIEGFVKVDNEIKLFVKESGLNQTIIKSFLDEFAQTSSTIRTILKNEPLQIDEEFFSDFSNKEEYLESVPISKSKPDTVVIFFYALIAMTCIYGGFFGIRIIQELQADLSPQGARINLVPVHKLKILICDITAALLVHYTIILILLAFMIFILKVDFGGQIGYIFLTSFIGSITGITFGTFVGAVVKKGENAKIGIMISVSMLFSFFAGLMYADIKYIVNNTVPILGYINPVNLLADAFYCLYYYDGYSKFGVNILILAAFIIVFCTGTYLALRRKRYASV